MSGIKFMGEQDDPDMDNAEGRGFPRIYDGTKRSLLDDVRRLLQHVADYEHHEDPAMSRAAEAEAARALVVRIDGGER